MLLSKEERIEIILQAGYRLRPYRVGFVNKENILPMYGDFLTTLYTRLLYTNV